MRTRYSFYNFIVSTITAIVLPLVGFLKVQLFISLYGDQLNGLQVTMAQVITFLNICELAYSLAFRQLLFKPLAKGDKQTVLSIYHGATKIFKFTGAAVLVLGVIVALVFPFFAQSPLNYIQTVLMFIALCIPYGISYFLMGPNFVIIADQKEYKINIWIQSFAIIRMFLMILVILAGLPFVFILIIEGLNILIPSALCAGFHRLCSGNTRSHRPLRPPSSAGQARIFRADHHNPADSAAFVCHAAGQRPHPGKRRRLGKPERPPGRAGVGRAAVHTAGRRKRPGAVKDI